MRGGTRESHHCAAYQEQERDGRDQVQNDMIILIIETPYVNENARIYPACCIMI